MPTMLCMIVSNKSRHSFLSYAFSTQRMNANNVYQEVIQDKNHIHMNSTKWTTLTDFVQYLGKKGLCVVEETERGWYVTYIERDPALLSRQEKLKKKTEADQREERKAAEQRETLRMEAAKALDRAGCAVERKASEIGSREGGEKMEMKLGGKAGGKKRKARAAGKLSLLEEDDDSDDETGGGNSGSAKPDAMGRRMDQLPGKPKKPTMAVKHAGEPKMQSTQMRDSDSRENAAKRQKPNGDKEKRKDYWLYRDIVVRIISQKLAGGEYYKRKAVVDKVIDKYQAEVEVLESSRKARDGGDVLRIDQDDLETVVPKEPGEKVRIVNGRHRGKKARVERLDKQNYRAELRLVEDDRTVTLDYEDFSKLA